MGWVSAALLAALFAGITSILAKCGVRETDSDIATGIRTAVVLVFAWIVVFVTGAQGGIARIAPLSWTFLVASGLCDRRIVDLLLQGAFARRRQQGRARGQVEHDPGRNLRNRPVRRDEQPRDQARFHRRDRRGHLPHDREESGAGRQ